MKNYREILNEELQIRLRENPSFSLRAFARTLDMSPSGLSQILSGKREISLDRAAECAEALGWKGPKAEEFLLKVQLEKAKTVQKKNTVLNRLKDAGFVADSKTELSIERFRLISSWHAFAILEYLSHPTAEKTEAAIARTLSLDRNTVGSLLKRLTDMGMVEWERSSNTFRRAGGYFVVEGAEREEAIIGFYKDLQPLILEAMTSQAGQERPTGVETFLLDETLLPEVRDATYQYLDRLRAISRKSKNPRSVYQAFASVFRLSAKEIPMTKSGSALSRSSDIKRGIRK